MRLEHWPLKVAFAVAAFLIAGADMTFPGKPFTPGLVMFVSLLLAGEAFSDREKLEIERERAERLKVARERAEAEARGSEAAESLRLQKRAFKAGLRLGILKTSYVYNDDLLRLRTTPPDLLERLKEKQSKIAAEAKELQEQFWHLIDSEGEDT